MISFAIVLPLAGAGLSVLVGRWRSAQRIIGVTTLVVVAAVALMTVIRVDRDGTEVVQAGRWPAPLGISLVADRLSAIMLAVSAIVLLTVLLYAIGQPGREQTHVG